MSINNTLEKIKYHIESDLNKGKYDDAIYKLNELLEKNLDNKNLTDVLFLLAKVSLQIKQFDYAQTLISELLTEEPLNEKYLSFQSEVQNTITEQILSDKFEEAHNKEQIFNILKYGYQLLKYQKFPLRTHMILSEILFSMGKARLAHNHVLKALEYDPNNKDLLDNMVSYLHYTCDSDYLEIKKFAKQYSLRAFPEHKGKEYKTFPQLDFNKKNKLRIGFISGDFKSHVISLWIGNFFPKLQENNLEIFCYCNNEWDHVTTLWTQRCNFWRDIRNLNDEDAANLIHKDRINILIDLSGHTTLNRLGIIALRPAPVQTCWLGNCSPIGIKTLDYTLVDSYSVPPRPQRDLYLEKVYRLPNIMCSFNFAETFPAKLESTLRPYRANGFVTFGCLNNMIKLNKECFDTWIEILKATPNSKLYLCNHALKHSNIQEYIKNYFSCKHIAKDRLILKEANNVTRNEYLNYFKNIDIYLDTFPIGAGTTCIDALFMGVPIINLEGEHLLHRMPSTILQITKNIDLIAKCREDYISKAINLWNSRELIDRYNKNLRTSLLISEIAKVNEFAKDFSDAMRNIWRRFVDEQSQ